MYISVLFAEPGLSVFVDADSIYFSKTLYQELLCAQARIEFLYDVIG